MHSKLKKATEILTKELFTLDPRYTSLVMKVKDLRQKLSTEIYSVPMGKNTKTYIMGHHINKFIFQFLIKTQIFRYYT